MLIDNSYHIMIVGSSLQSLSLFALSFAKPGQFYMVSSLADLIDVLPMLVTRFLYFKVSFLGLGWASRLVPPWRSSLSTSPKDVHW
jgi:hypothetical protein